MNFDLFDPKHAQIVSTFLSPSANPNQDASQTVISTSSYGPVQKQKFELKHTQGCISLIGQRSEKEILKGVPTVLKVKERKRN